MGGPSPGSACLRRKSRVRRGTPRHGSARHNRAATIGRRRGDPPTQQRAQTACGQGIKGATPARPRATPSRSQGEEEEGDPPNCSARTMHAHGGERGTPQPGSVPPQREAKERKKRGNPPNCSVLTSRMAYRRGRGGGAEPEVEGGGTPRVACAPWARLEGEGGEGDPHTREGGGNTPQAVVNVLHAWPDTGDGGHQLRPAESPHRQTKRYGGGRKWHELLQESERAHLHHYGEEVHQKSRPKLT